MSISTRERSSLDVWSTQAAVNRLLVGNGIRRISLPQTRLTPESSLERSFVLGVQDTRQRFDKNRWLCDLEKLSDDEIDDAIVNVLDKLDQWLEKGQVELCRDILNTADPERLSVEISLALLSGTLPAKQELFEARQLFCNRVELRLRREMPADVEIILRGLRP